MRRQGLPKWCSEFRDRHGHWRVRGRRTGLPVHYFAAAPGTDAFGEEYRAWLAGAAAPVGAARAAPGSVSALIAEYYTSSKFTRLAPSTQRGHRGVLERFRAEHGDKPVARLEAVHIDRILDKMAERPAAANTLRKRLHTLMAFAVKRGYRKGNPIADVERIDYVEHGFRTWSEEDIAAYRARWPIGAPQRLAFELLLFTGLRRADIVKLGPQHLSGGHFVVRTSKSRGRTRLEIPAHPTLLRHLALAPTGALTYTQTAFGRSRSEKAFTNWIREAALAAGLPSDSSPHGLRKAACRRLAEAGCTPHHIQAITGHKSLAEVETYTRAVEQRRMAGAAIRTIIDDWSET